jgi:sugar phosphate isomerase/epimerase
LSKKINANYYSFHGGFLIDPEINTLGRALETKILISKKDGIKNFINSVQILSAEAKKLGMLLLIENNVLTTENLLKYKKNPLLFVRTNEIISIMNKLPSNIGILLDVGHLNISAKTLNFCKYEFIRKCNFWIKGYHLSENNGLHDQNNPIKENSWFWRFLKKNLTYSLEIKYKNIPSLKKQIKLANKKINNLC